MATLHNRKLLCTVLSVGKAHNLVPVGDCISLLMTDFAISSHFSSIQIL